jgi:DNA repair protein RecO (recombination protein O)
MATGGSRKGERRVEGERAYLLHAIPYRETSLILEAMTADHGRVALMAKGAKRRTSALRAVLIQFAPLAFNWSGSGEVKTLTRAEWVGGWEPLPGKSLLSAYYLNELLLRLLPREDPHPRVFDAYEAALAGLSSGERGLADPLRAFEAALLQDIGYAPAFDHTSDGEAVDPEAAYRVDPARGVLPAAAASGFAAVSGRALLAMARGDFDDAALASDIRAVLRSLLNYHMEGKPLHTRQVLLALQQQ